MLCYILLYVGSDYGETGSSSGSTGTGTGAAVAAISDGAADAGILPQIILRP